MLNCLSPPPIRPDLTLFTSLQALERCQLKDIVASKPEKLDALGSLCFLSKNNCALSFELIQVVTYVTTDQAYL